MTDHIVRSFDEELKRLSQSISQMGGLVEAAISQSITALSRRDSQMASAVIGADARIDALQAEIDEQVIRLLALRQPMASDLRTVIASLRIANELERIGDYAANLGKRTLALNMAPAMRPTAGVVRLGKLVQGLLADTLDAFAASDAEKAEKVRDRDLEIDELYTSLFRELLTYMMEDPRNITPCTHILFMAKNLERVGDHATNIAETVYYVVRGRPMPTERPKSDKASFTMVDTSGAALVANEADPT
jgi:phosphate transport system protein